MWLLIFVILKKNSTIRIRHGKNNGIGCFPVMDYRLRFKVTSRIVHKSVIRGSVDGLAAYACDTYLYACA